MGRILLRLGLAAIFGAGIEVKLAKPGSTNLVKFIEKLQYAPSIKKNKLE
ncbi:hypothetical protein [Flavobacterium rhizosphaerae]|uniref:Uncharacterized protein n=1 Tax=Flavobacterium rhizosphaerae TaxID=3163298 RepID=A0ABW8YTF3_9FLAO